MCPSQVAKLGLPTFLKVCATGFPLANALQLATMLQNTFCSIRLVGSAYNIIYDDTQTLNPQSILKYSTQFHLTSAHTHGYGFSLPHKWPTYLIRS